MKDKGKKRYTDSELKIYAKRIAQRGRGRLTAAERTLLEQPGETGHRLRAFVKAAQAVAKDKSSKGSARGKEAAKHFSPHASRTSDLLKLAKQAPKQATFALVSALQRPLTIAEFAARIEVAPATLAKVLAEIGFDYDQLRAAAVGPGIEAQAALMALLQSLADDLANDKVSGLTAEKLSHGFQGISRIPVFEKPEFASAPSSEAVSSAAASPSFSIGGLGGEEPDTLEGWIESAQRDFDPVGPRSFEAQSTAIAHRAELFVQWVERQPSSLRTDEGEEIVNPLKFVPSRLLISPQKIDGFPTERLRGYLAAFAAAVIVRIGLRPKLDRFRPDAMQSDLAWLVTEGYPGAAQAMSALCALPTNANLSAVFRLTRNQLLSAHAEKKITLSAADAEQLHASV